LLVFRVACRWYGATGPGDVIRKLRGPAGGFGFSWRDLSRLDRRQGLEAI
jgi:hypothetical protein